MQSQQQLNAADSESAAAATTTVDNVNIQPPDDVFVSPLNPVGMTSSDGHSEPVYAGYPAPGHDGAASVMYGGESAGMMLTAQLMQQAQQPGGVFQVNNVYSWQSYKERKCIAVNGNPSHSSYRVSLAIWDHAVLPATRHK